MSELSVASDVAKGPPAERYAMQIQASAAAAIEDLAIKTYELDESRKQQTADNLLRVQAEVEVARLMENIATLQLSVEEYSKSNGVLDTENSQLKAQVRDYKNQLSASRSGEDLLVDANSLLTSEVADSRQLATVNKEVIEDLRRDIKSYELLQKSQPSYMYAEIMAQTRVGIQDENKKLADEVHLLRAKGTMSP
eukprot:CAMPEP_0171735088 /NCGR_PEP_ID=MMETSP0991-20121206/31355_1 /TAXON_ID=483369 /ORGANISM="non described non described, Strain CCMP2098" /LENGTH=194 /DNA_ID=CAMNT_0012331299 /DNA_START=21 /DNA_END=605 /DNA_ORIENTATION=-